jgi:hypothetical protein
MRLAPRSRVEGNTRELDADEALTVARRLLKAKGRRRADFNRRIIYPGPGHRMSGLETVVFSVGWLALAILGGGLLLLAWERLLVRGWGWLLAGVVRFVFWLALAICGAGLLILGYEEGGKWVYFLSMILCVVLYFVLQRATGKTPTF